MDEFGLYYFPLFLFVILSGIYYKYRNLDVLKDVPYKNLLQQFLYREVLEDRKQMGQVVADLSGALGLSRLFFLYGVIKIGGAGALVWFFLASFLLRDVWGIWASIWDYFVPEAHKARSLNQNFKKFIETFGRFRGARLIGAALAIFEVGFMATQVSLYYFATLTHQCFGWDRAKAVVFFLGALALLFLVKRNEKMHHRGRIFLFWAFVVLSFFYLFRNPLYIIQGLKTIFFDAFHYSAFISGIVGHGLWSVITGGGSACFQFGIYQSFFLPGLKKKGPHPIEMSIYQRTENLLAGALHFFVGFLMVIAIFAGISFSGWEGRLFFSLVFISLYFSIDSAWQWIRESAKEKSPKIYGPLRFIALFLLPSFLCMIYSVPFESLFFFARHVAGVGILFYLLMAVFSSGRYFLLLSDYRDKYIFRIIPYPKIFVYHKERNISPKGVRKTSR